MELLEERGRAHFVNPVTLSMVNQTRRQLLDLCDRPLAKEVTQALPRVTGSDDEKLMKLVLLAWPDRLCKRRQSDLAAAVMVGQIGVRLDPTSVVRDGQFFVALDVRGDSRSRKGEATVRMASRVDEAWLEELLPGHLSTRDTVEVDAISGKAIGVRQRMFAGLELAQVRGVTIDKQAMQDALREGALARAGELVKASEPGQAVLARLAFCKRHAAELNWPDITDEQIIEAACAGAKNLDDVRRNIVDAVQSMLIYPLDRKLIELAPTTIEVPTGSEIALDYLNDPPVLAVRLQELFGLTSTPTIAGGRVRVLLHLLGPNYRPVQVTSDLASFWQNTYPQVRKDLRARYPKHSWPDDPTTAPAVRGARRRQPRS